jgi:hypothetical protein
MNVFSSFLSCLALAPIAQGLGLSGRLEATHEHFLDDRRRAFTSLSDPFGVPEVAKIVLEDPRGRFFGPESWHRNVVSTVFWVGELPSENNPTPNTASAWDGNWQANYGGYDQPDKRDGLLPAGFVPTLNPFYIALPYNDIGRDGKHRPEASSVIPWFWEDYRGEGISVCKDRWVSIHHKGRICYAQWEDVGPFETNHFQYVFGKESPRPNRNQNAGIDLSPAVRDFLGLSSGEMIEWRFTYDREVPKGPWRDWSAGPAQRGQ